jgi:hypothetical protein
MVDGIRPNPDDQPYVPMGDDGEYSPMGGADDSNPVDGDSQLPNNVEPPENPDSIDEAAIDAIASREVSIILDLLTIFGGFALYSIVMAVNSIYEGITFEPFRDDDLSVASLSVGQKLLLCLYYLIVDTLISLIIVPFLVIYDSIADLCTEGGLESTWDKVYINPFTFFANQAP